MFKNKISTLGFSLIELLISITISCLLLNCLITIFFITKKNHQAQLELNEIQENLRVITQMLGSDVRMAGYIGCAKLTNSFPFSTELSEKNKMTTYSDADMKENSDGISFTHISESHDYLTKRMRNHYLLYVTGKNIFEKNDFLLISDCKKAEIFQVKNIIDNEDGSQEIESIQPLTNQYLQHSEVARFEINSYYVGKTSRTDAKGFPIYALYTKDIYDHKQEVIDNVENMIIDFDVMEEGELLKIPANKLSEGAQIKGVAIQLVIPSWKDFYIYAAVRQL